MSAEKVTTKAWAIKFTDPDYPLEFDCQYAGVGVPRLFGFKYQAQKEIKDYWRPRSISAIPVRVVIAEAVHD